MGLHVTAQELAIWRDRWVDGVSGDEFLHTRINEEKTRLREHASNVASNVDEHLWAIESMDTDAQGRYTGGAGMSTARSQAGRLLGAAFAALVTQDATRLDQIGSILHLQPDQPRCQFATDPGWAYGVGTMRDASTPSFSISHAVIKHLHTYTYHQVAVQEGWANDLDPAHHVKLRNWYEAWANYNLAALEDRLDQAFNGGWSDGEYSSFEDATCTWCEATVAYRGGPLVYSLQDRFNNRFMRTVGAIGLIGLLLDDEHLKARAWRATRDLLVYGVWPHGAITDNHRAATSSRWQQHYMVLNLSHAMTLVDAFARAGDASLYELVTTNGVLGTNGAPNSHPENTESAKSFLFAIRAMARYGNQTYDRWHGDERINFRGPFTDYHEDKDNLGLHDSFIQANLYYRDELAREWYRGTNGQPTWVVHGNGATDLNDAWAFPAPYLMWAGLEGQVWPFPGVPQP